MIKSIDDYIRKQTSPQQSICQQLKKIIEQTFPKISKEMKWGVPAFDDGRFYIVALKDHVNLGFSSKGLTKKELGLFDGGGSTTRHLKIKAVKEIDKKRIVKLLKLVKGKK